MRDPPAWRKYLPFALRGAGGRGAGARGRGGARAQGLSSGRGGGRARGGAEQLSLSFSALPVPGASSGLSSGLSSGPPLGLHCATVTVAHSLWGPQCGLCRRVCGPASPEAAPVDAHPGASDACQSRVSHVSVTSRDLQASLPARPAMSCKVLQSPAMSCNVLQCPAMSSNVLQCPANCRLQCPAMSCKVHVLSCSRPPAEQDLLPSRDVRTPRCPSQMG